MKTKSKYLINLSVCTMLWHYVHFACGFLELHISFVMMHVYEFCHGFYCIIHCIYNSIFTPTGLFIRGVVLYH